MPRTSRRRRIAIASVLVALIAVATFLIWERMRRRVYLSPLDETTEMLRAIRRGEEAYHDETHAYANISTALAANQRTNHFALYPQAPREPGAYTAFAWGGECPASACNAGWNVLPVHAVGFVRFGYSVVAGPAGKRPTELVTIDGVPVVWPVPKEDWYIITAVGDVNGNGVFTTVLATSFDDSIRTDGPLPDTEY